LKETKSTKENSHLGKVHELKVSSTFELSLNDHESYQNRTKVKLVLNFEILYTHNMCFNLHKLVCTLWSCANLDFSECFKELPRCS